jgi:hypothetical protein
VPRSYSFPRASSQGSSSLGALACSALGAVVQNGTGASAFFFFSFLAFSLGRFLLFCAIILTPSAVCPSLLRPSTALAIRHSSFLARDSWSLRGRGPDWSIHLFKKGLRGSIGRFRFLSAPAGLMTSADCSVLFAFKRTHRPHGNRRILHYSFRNAPEFEPALSAMRGHDHHIRPLLFNGL